MGFPQAISRLQDRYDRYESLLTEDEIELSDCIEDLYESRMETEIMEYVTKLTVDETMAFVNDGRPSQFYGEILRIRLIKYNASRRAILAAQQDPNIEIPQWYSWCGSKQEYLSQLDVGEEDNRHQLIVLLRKLRELVGSIRRAAILDHLASEQITALKAKMEAFESYYPIAYSELFGGSILEQH